MKIDCTLAFEFIVDIFNYKKIGKGRKEEDVKSFIQLIQIKNSDKNYTLHASLYTTKIIVY